MRTRKTFYFIIIPVVVIILLSCNIVPQAIRGIFASSTPTATNTPTPTNTPTSTSTPTMTPTPLPAVNLESCAFARYCDGVASIFDYVEQEVPQGEEYYIEIPFEDKVNFTVGWVAMDEATLAENIKHLRFFFEIDGQSYYDDRFVAQDITYTVENPDPGYPSIFMGVATSDWMVGEPHQIRFGYEFDAEIFDGWDTYPAGTRIEYIFWVTPVILPTVTPTPSPMPIPTAVPYTATPSCSRNATISVVNDTGAYVTIYLKGPAAFTFNVAAGNQTISVCSGNYSYTAYGCGGASVNGTASDGDEIEFWCE